jgi:hypothetical protein
MHIIITFKEQELEKNSCKKLYFYVPLTISTDYSVKKPTFKARLKAFAFGLESSWRACFSANKSKGSLHLSVVASCLSSN